MKEQRQEERTGAGTSVKETIPAPLIGRFIDKTRSSWLSPILAAGVLLCGSAVQAATSSSWSTAGWPDRTAREHQIITTVIDTHETVLLLDLLRKGKRQKAEGVLFAMLGLRLMEVKDLNNGKQKRFSPGEQKQLCKELGPLTKLESSKMFRSMARRDPKQAAYLRSDIATFRKSCAAISK